MKTFPLPSGLSLTFRWTPDGKAIMYSLRRSGVANLWVQPIEGGEPKQLTNFTSDLIHSYDVSRDGKQFVFSRGTKSSDVVLFSGISTEYINHLDLGFIPSQIGNPHVDKKDLSVWHSHVWLFRASELRRY